VNIDSANDMDTFGKRNSPQVIQEIQLSAYRGRKLRTRRALYPLTAPSAKHDRYVREGSVIQCCDNRAPPPRGWGPWKRWNGRQGALIGTVGTPLRFAMCHCNSGR
jgi:hypothetical protein